jgi:hypothetical protein
MSLTAESARGISPRSQIPDTPVRVSGGSGDAHHHALSVASLAPVNGFWVWVNTSRGDDEDDDEKDLSSLSFEILRKDIKPIRRAQAGYIERAERDLANEVHNARIMLAYEQNRRQGGMRSPFAARRASPGPPC